MPSPVTPQQIRETIPGPSGNFCEKFLRVLTLPRVFYEWYRSVYLENGEFTDDFKAQLCATGCVDGGSGGGGGGGGSLAAPQGLMATDGDHRDKIVLTWGSVVTAEGYDIFRNTTNDSATASLIASVGQVLTYEDEDVDNGTVYHYWVRARKGTTFSVLSAPDTGYSVDTIESVSDLLASKGYYGTSLVGPIEDQVGTIALEFSAIGAANAYDIYRNTTDDFDSATKIESNRMPFDNTNSNQFCSPTPCTQNIFLNNGPTGFFGNTLLVYRDNPPNAFTKFYYWVVAKQVDGSNIIAASGQSASAVGWAVGDGVTDADDIIAMDLIDSSGTAGTVPAGATRAWVAVIGMSGGGAGGNGSLGGGGGGGGAIMAGVLSVAAGKHLKYGPVSQASLAGGASETNGGFSPNAEVLYDGTGSYVALITLTTGAGGVWNAGGGGSGGNGGTASATGLLTDQQSQQGHNGMAASVSAGGRGGSMWGGARAAPAHFNGTISVPNQKIAVPLGSGGGGSSAVAAAPSGAQGDHGRSGQLFVVYYSA